MTSSLSVVIPTLDEAETLPRLLQQLARQQGLHLQIVVADGGSQDQTLELARAHGAVRASTPRGRGAQMNAGRRHCSAPWLCFLHADSSVDDPHLLHRALETLRQARQDAQEQVPIAGHFPLRFDSTLEGGRRRFAFLEAKSRSNRRYTINGDQGLLIAASDFDRLGGFDDALPFMEDQRFSESLLGSGGRWLLLPGVLGTSARRFEREGASRRLLLMALMMLAEHGRVPGFLETAPDLYRAQREAEVLELAPFLQQFAHCIAALPWRERIATSARMARFAAANAWQLRTLAELTISRD
jgi:rSAM/selenodomain-associated transferase 2